MAAAESQDGAYAAHSPATYTTTCGEKPHEAEPTTSAE